MTEPTFTVTHEEQRWNVTLSQGEKTYTITMTRYGTGKIRLTPSSGYDKFELSECAPNLVLAIGRLFIAAARKAGATDA